MAEATSITQLARIVNRGVTTVRKWLKHPRFPVNREAPWDDDAIAEIIAWRDSLQEDRSAEGRAGRSITEPPADQQDKNYWLMRKYRAQALEAEGNLVNGDAAIRRMTRLFTELRMRLLMVPASLGTLCDRAPQAQVERVADEQIRSALDDIATRLGDASDTEEDDPSGGDGAEDSAAA